VVKRPILHQRTKFRKGRSNRYGDIAIFVIFKMAAAKIQNFNGRSPVGGQCASSCQISFKSVKRLQRYGHLTVFKMAAVREMLRVVKGHIVHHRTKFHEDRSNRYGDIAIFVIFQDGGRRHFGFLKIRNFNDRSAVRGQYASLYQILSKSVKRLQRYSDLTVFSKWRPSAIFDLLGADWDHPRRVLVGLYRCAKFG